MLEARRARSVSSRESKKSKYKDWKVGGGREDESRKSKSKSRRIREREQEEQRYKLLGPREQEQQGDRKIREWREGTGRAERE